MSNPKDLELLIRSRYPIIAVGSPEEQRVAATLSRVAARIGVPLYDWTLSGGLRREGADNPVYDTREIAKALANVASMDTEGLYFLRDLRSFLDDPTVVRLLLDLVEPFARDRRALVLSGDDLRLPHELRPYAARFTLSLPDRDAIAEHARTFLDELVRRHGIEVRLDPAARDRLLEGLRGLTLFEIDRALAGAALDDLVLNSEDVEAIQEQKSRRLADDGILELEPAGTDAPRLCGLDRLRTWIARRGAGLRPGAREFGLEPPRGVLLLGVQGCGKSLAARDIARQWRVPLLRLHSGRLYDRFIGESEARLERVLGTAERLAPCVLLIDEIEKSLAAGSASTDGGLSQRILGRLLSWLQERTAPVFVVATCNRVEALPPELMRKGRFDEVFFVDLPTPTERAAIFAAQLERRGHDPSGLDMSALVEGSMGFSGAEIEAAVVAALYSAFADGSDVTSRHLLTELRTTVPLSRARAEEIDSLRHWAAGRAVPASGRASAA